MPQPKASSGRAIPYNSQAHLRFLCQDYTPRNCPMPGARECTYPTKTRYPSANGVGCIQKKRIRTHEDRADQLQRENLRLQKELALTRQGHIQSQVSKVQYLELAEYSTDHIFILDANGAFQFSNDRVEQFGLKKGDELVGLRLQDVYQRDVYGAYRDKLNEVLGTGNAVSFHHQKMTPEGEESHIDTLYPILIHDQLWGVGGICCNISEQKRMEKQLFQSQKMEALGTLVAGVAHEINNPINLILFNLPLLEKMWQDLMPVLESHIAKAPEKKIGGLMPVFVRDNLPRLLSDMEMAANRVARIVSGLKGFTSKSNPAEKRDIDANKAVDNAVCLAAATIKKSKTVMEMDLAPDLPVLHANLQNIEQIVLNLIINALESIRHDRGKVCITTRFIEKDKCITIDVGDNGRGVNPKVAEKIFDPFVTDRQTSGGTGLGLSVTYNLVKAHEGDISFKTKVGQGTTFTIALPTGPRQKPFNIMVVDDDGDFREMILRALIRNTNCIVEDFANGAEALIRMGSHPPDLLILDMFMPEMDGLGVCRAIKNELGLELMKVIIVTGFPDHPNLYEAACMGFGQILTKPLAIEEFIHIVNENLNGKSIEQFSHPYRR